jgi:class 3 adenylate cyclase/HAMP domain-containing protein
MKNNERSHFFSLRLKLIAAFIVVGFGLSIFLGLAAHNMLEEKLFLELRKNVVNMTHMGVEIIDKAALERLKSELSDNLSDQQREQIETSADYKRVSDQLNFIRDTQPDLIRYVYIVSPSHRDGYARYIVDADVLKDSSGENQDEISHFNLETDISEFPVMQQAMDQKSSLIESEFTRDAAFGVNSISGYAPVMSADGQTLIGLLGLDMVDTEVQNALSAVLRQAIVAACLALIVSLMMAIVMGTVLTRGIIKLDNLVQSFAQKDFEARSSLRSNDEVGRLGVSFNYMADIIQDYSARLEALVDAYGRFVPHDLLRLLDKDSILDVHLGDQTEKEMSVLFSDIRNFTSISERLTPQENFNFINNYLNRVGPHIRAHKGIIDKYIGDAVMALFPGSVDDALDAALKMLNVTNAYNTDPRNEGSPSVKIGIGLHVGKVMLGTIGETERMDGTVISDSVNLASRLEGMSKKYGSSVIISDAVVKKIGRKDKYLVRQVDKVSVAGKTDVISLYEVFNEDDLLQRSLKASTLNSYNRALASFYDRDFQSAESIFSEIVANNENDLPARLYRDRARELLSQGVPADWDGVMRYQSKG